MAVDNKKRSLPPAKKKVGKFRLVRGKHVEEGPDGCTCPDCTADEATKESYLAGEIDSLSLRGHVYQRGDVIHSASDLVKKFNSPGSVKFERLRDDDEEAKNPPKTRAQLEAEKRARDEAGQGGKMTVEDIKGMSDEQLRKLAADNDIDVSRVKDKAEAVKVIATALDIKK